MTLTEADFQAIIGQITNALIEDDFDRYRAAVSLPLTIVPRNGSAIEFDTEESLREDFALYVQSIRLHHITEIWRDVLDIRSDERKAQVRFRSTMLSGASLVVDPWEATMTFARADKSWRMCRLDSSLGHINWTRGQAALPDTRRWDTTGKKHEN